jgi:hypothetical protein
MTRGGKRLYQQEVFTKKNRKKSIFYVAVQQQASTHQLAFGTKAHWAIVIGSMKPKKNVN